MDEPAAPLAVALDNALPQTQCTRCGYDGCAPYAQAMAIQSAYHREAVGRFLEKKPLRFRWGRGRG